MSGFLQVYCACRCGVRRIEKRGERMAAQNKLVVHCWASKTAPITAWDALKNTT